VTSNSHLRIGNFLARETAGVFCVNIYNQFVEIIPKLFQFVESLLDARQESFLILICHSDICIVSVVNRCTFCRPNAKLIADYWSSTTSGILKCEACFSCFRFDSSTVVASSYDGWFVSAVQIECSRALHHRQWNRKEFIVTCHQSHFLELMLYCSTCLLLVLTPSTVDAFNLKSEHLSKHALDSH